MKSYPTKDIRNVVLIGGSKSGKTTLSEAMLFEGKVIDRRGTVEDKNTISDNTEFEQTNQKSINATPLYAEFQNCKINIIDAPGSDDFSGGALAAFKVVESAVLVMNGTAGVEVGTTIFSRYAAQYGKPVIIAVNQLDHEKANWDGVRSALGEEFGKKAILCQFPPEQPPEGPRAHPGPATDPAEIHPRVAIDLFFRHQARKPFVTGHQFLSFHTIGVFPDPFSFPGGSPGSAGGGGAPPLPAAAAKMGEDGR